MDNIKKKSSKKANWVVSVIVLLFFGGAAVFVVMLLNSAGSGKKRSYIATVTLVKPTPPPVKEKPPEPEVKKEIKKQEIVEPTADDRPKTPDNREKDNPPEGKDLGVDAEGGAGGDAFGLVGRKGGRALIGGGGGKASLLQKYAWYTRIVQDEVKKTVKKRLEHDGGIPRGKLQTLVKVRLDGTGSVIDYRIVGPSGNERMDGAVSAALTACRISEPPPEGMPPRLTLKISSQG